MPGPEAFTDHERVYDTIEKLNKNLPEDVTGELAALTAANAALTAQIETLNSTIAELQSNQLTVEIYEEIVPANVAAQTIITHNLGYLTPSWAIGTTGGTTGNILRYVYYEDENTARMLWNAIVTVDVYVKFFKFSSEG